LARVVLVCVLLIAAAGVVGAWRSSPRADAQEPAGSFTVISNGILITASNGHATLPVGINDGIFGITCNGSAPRGGTPRIPGQVVTDVTVNDTLLRIIQDNGVMVTGTVRINCVRSKRHQRVPRQPIGSDKPRPRASTPRNAGHRFDTIDEPMAVAGRYVAGYLTNGD
jgi:hypothetical protein